MFNDSIWMFFVFLGVGILRNLAVPLPLLVGAILSRKGSSSWAPVVLIAGAGLWVAASVVAVAGLYLLLHVSPTEAATLSIVTELAQTLGGIVFVVGFIKYVAERR